MTSQEFKRWLSAQGCTFAPGHGGHLKVFREGKRSVLPMHGKGKELGTGLVKRIKKDLGLLYGLNPGHTPAGLWGATAMFYALTLSKDSNGTWLVDVPALPHVHTFGKTKADARARALDGVLTGLEMLVDSKEPIPAPLAVAPKGDAVRVSALVAAKVELHNAMLSQGVGKYRLGKRLSWHSPQVDRLVDFRHASKVDQIEQALEALGRRLVVTSAA